MLFPVNAIFGNHLALINDDKQIDKVLVEEFVKIAHSDFEKLKNMLEETPHLINATWDWKNGDFETAIGAAGHMGHKEMANYLIQKGARFDIFVMTMLGKTERVKSTLSDYPNLLYSLGPHGFTLLHHAKQGGAESEELYEFFLSQGLTETFIKTY